MVRINQQGSESVDSAHAHFEIFESLSQDEYEQFSRATLMLSQFSSNLDLFIMAYWNYRDYAETHEAILDTYIRKDWEYLALRPPLLDLNRRVLNLLASVRMYLDHTDRRLKKLYGEESAIFKSFNASRKSAYDNHFGYRFLEGFRNYAQHNALPVDFMQVDAQRRTDKPDIVSYSLQVGINRDALLQKDAQKLKSVIKTDLLNQPAIIEFNPLLKTLMECLRKISRNLAEAELPTLHESASYIKNLVARMPKIEGQPCIFDVDTDANGKIVYSANIEFKSEEIHMQLVDVVLEGDIDKILSIPFGFPYLHTF
jgi:hypothetical protein